jgi:hypothetical protein
MDELAAFINSLPAGARLAGRPGPDGVVFLHVAGDGPGALAETGLRARVAARVAVEVVLQQVMGMPGAFAHLSNVREQFDGDQCVQAGWLAPPVTILARLYRKTMDALPETARLARRMHSHVGAIDCHDGAVAPPLSPEQALALEKLATSLVRLARPVKMHGKA